MAEVIGVRFKEVGKVYYFDPNGIQMKKGDMAIDVYKRQLLGFPLRDAMSAGVIGAADGPTAIMVSQVLNSDYKGAITVAAYSYMALVPIIQPMAIKLVTTKKDVYKRQRMSLAP